MAVNMAVKKSKAGLALILALSLHAVSRKTVLCAGVVSLSFFMLSVSLPEGIS